MDRAESGVLVYSWGGGRYVPHESPGIARAQRCCAIALLIAVCAFVTLCVFLAWQFSWSACLVALAVWFVSTATAGALGYWIEKQATA